MVTNLQISTAIRISFTLIASCQEWFQKHDISGWPLQLSRSRRLDLTKARIRISLIGQPLEQIPRSSMSRVGIDVTHWPGADPSKWAALGLWADIRERVRRPQLFTNAASAASARSVLRNQRPLARSTSRQTSRCDLYDYWPDEFYGRWHVFSQPNAPPGTYTITFGTITGFATPPPQTQTLLVGGSINFTGLYHRSLKVLIWRQATQRRRGQALPNPLVVQLTDQIVLQFLTFMSLFPSPNSRWS